MYQVLAIEESGWTNFSTLRNLETGTVIECFDDSVIFSQKPNFGFMKEGGRYDCKISLFGSVAIPVKPDLRQYVAEYTVTATGVLFGKRRYTEVRLGRDVYYISRGSLKEHEEFLSCKPGDKIPFCAPRKDLIQVDGVLHPDLLR